MNNPMGPRLARLAARPAAGRRRWRRVMSPLELGSDIGGSLRAPAHYCGVFAHKPTQALVPGRGHNPSGGPALPRSTIDLAVVGPMARSAGDLSLLLDVIAGPDAPVATAYRLALPPPRHDDLKEFPSSRPRLAPSGADGQHGARRRGAACGAACQDRRQGRTLEPAAARSWRIAARVYVQLLLS